MNLINFADDTLLYFSFDNPDDMQRMTNSELIKIDNLVNTNNLKLNMSKTKLMIFSPNNKK